MPRINLLAWRDELRTHRRNQFYIALGGSVVGAAAAIGISYLIFDSIINHRQDIERSCLFEIDWDRLDHRRASRIRSKIRAGGWKSKEEEWPSIQNEMVSRMRFFVDVMGPIIKKLPS